MKSPGWLALAGGTKCFTRLLSYLRLTYALSARNQDARLLHPAIWRRAEAAQRYALG